MGLDLDSVGRRGATTQFAWTARDAAIYALGIGAGQDPLDDVELPFTTESAIYPMMAMAIGVAGANRPSFGDIDRSRFVHSAQELVIHAPLPLEGTVRLECDIAGIHDVGSGALVSWSTIGAIDTGPVFTSISTGFLIGGGGFGGEPAPADAWTPPLGPASLTRSLPITSQQALLYRLTGDRNPLHSDPGVARSGGFDRPLLHGLSLLGAAARVILRERAPDLRALRARFTAPVHPGDELEVHVWKGGPLARFQVRTTDGTLVLDRGEVTPA